LEGIDKDLYEGTEREYLHEGFLSILGEMEVISCNFIGHPTEYEV